jgi:hypothetical protein
MKMPPPDVGRKLILHPQMRKSQEADDHTMAQWQPQPVPQLPPPLLRVLLPLLPEAPPMTPVPPMMTRRTGRPDSG